jgi:signal transduction histidine kinase
MFDARLEEATQSQKDIIDRLAGVIGIAIDNALLYRAIQNANEKLKQVDKLKDEFVSLASHELRTPMTVIKSYVWLLLEGKTGKLTEQQMKYLKISYDSTNRLIGMVNDMLNISRIESGRFTIDPKPMSIATLIQEVSSEMGSRAAELGIKLVVQEPENATPNINADSDRIKQVLINLIGNSLKFTPKDGSITVSYYLKDSMVFVSIKDTGIGIKPEDMEKLFKKFNMVGGSSLTKQAGQGSGLGLYLSKNLVELHKGKIWVESEGEGKGTVFTFTLPTS